MPRTWFLYCLYNLLQLDVEVISCVPSTLKIAGSKPIKGFDVVFTDTVLFPEGGGQVLTRVLVTVLKLKGPNYNEPS